MKVSVCLITYNHERFIAQAIDSVLMQETNFDYELIIGEDDSQDRTRELVLAYRDKYPDKIGVLLNNRRNVIYVDGRPTGRWNFVNTLRHATGQYAALLDGDDYWTDPRKLQEQVRFLDQNLGCTLCFHNVEAVSDDGSRPPRIYRPSHFKQEYDLIDLLRGNFISCCSVMVRRGVVADFPDWFYGVSIGDWPLWVLHAQCGKIGYLDKTMATYRFHSGGVWGGASSQQRMLGVIDLLEHMNAHFAFQYSRTINETISETYFSLAVHHANCGRPADARASLIKSISRQPVNPRIKSMDMATLITRLYLSGAYRVLRRLRLRLSSTATR